MYVLYTRHASSLPVAHIQSLNHQARPDRRTRHRPHSRCRRPGRSSSSSLARRGAGPVALASPSMCVSSRMIVVEVCVECWSAAVVRCPVSVAAGGFGFTHPARRLAPPITHPDVKRACGLMRAPAAAQSSKRGTGTYSRESRLGFRRHSRVGALVGFI